ncbi:hypothetical protein [Crocosphaera sp.]|uniref:hypothetical protein n=1 Tax=Crocosphaera sp. TaxID=2729996 RepID=UPI003F272173|nr:hypothetical protein [Crocosphaera sp.]
MNEPITVSYSLEDVLKRMDDKLDSIQKDVMDLKVGVATLTEKVEGMDKRLEKVEGTQKNQVWALIILLAGAIATAGARLFFTSNP